MCAAGSRIPIVDPGIRPVRDISNAVIFLVAEDRDVTERTRTREKHSGSEARLGALADAIPQNIWASDPDGNNIYRNVRFLAFVGAAHGPKEIDWLDLVHPNDRYMSYELRRQSLVTGQSFEREPRSRRVDGVLSATGGGGWIFTKIAD